MCETLAQQQTATTVAKNRGRLETRTVTTTTTTVDEQYLDWPGAKQFIRLERHTVEKGQTRRSTTYAITSLPRAAVDAVFLLKHLHGRWRIENRCFCASVSSTQSWAMMPAAAEQVMRLATGTEFDSPPSTSPADSHKPSVLSAANIPPSPTS